VSKKPNLCFGVKNYFKNTPIIFDVYKGGVKKVLKEGGSCLVWVYGNIETTPKNISMNQGGQNGL